MYRDGPLRARPPEEIRYGVGRCALGRILVATSDAGIVTIMIRDKADQLVRDLRLRFPRAILVQDEKACRTVVARVIRYVAAPFRRFGLPLDIRGTELQRRVWNEVRRIPFGRTSTYSKIAEAIGAPKAIRAVANSCSRSWFAFAVPCHRVLHKGGTRPENRRDGRQYSWVDYEAQLNAGRFSAGTRTRSSGRLHSRAPRALARDRSAG
ncbi:MAG: methylated-DNA--[protein]-cysteine S-methyltransferase [Betaproteobacteria bacterium]